MGLIGDFTVISDEEITHKERKKQTMFYINNFYEKDKHRTVATPQPNSFFFHDFIITNEKDDVKRVYIPLIKKHKLLKVMY